MLIKTVQWNIGGGKIRNADDDPFDPLAYCHDALGNIIKVLKKYDANVVTIQESHTSKDMVQAEVIAKGLGLAYWVNDRYDKSHLEDGQYLSQCILSRFSMEEHSFEFFLNPKLEMVGPRGERWVNHEKGVTSCLLKIGNASFEIKTSHSVPFRKFCGDVFSDVLTSLREDMARKLKPKYETCLYQGDLNFDGLSIFEFFPKLSRCGMKEVVLGAPTTPKGKRYDRVLYRGAITHVRSVIVTDVLTDHYPVYSEFEVNI